MSTQRLLLIAPPNSYRTAAFIRAARRNSIEILVASEGRYSLVSEIASGLHVDLADPAAMDILIAANDEQAFAGVVSTDDSTVELGSRVAAQLHLPHNPPGAAVLSRRKDLARAALDDAGVPVPAFRLLDLDMPVLSQFDAFPFPAVIKPLALSASRGVIRVNNREEAIAACERVSRILAREHPLDAFSRSHLLVEQYIPGDEVALEGLLHAGHLDVLALFDKPDPLEGPFFEETIYTTPSRHPRDSQQQIRRVVELACAAMGLCEGAVHAELRLADNGPVVLEVASRTIGGECARLLTFGSGHTLEDLVIRHATGQALPVSEKTEAAGVMMLPTPRAGILRRIEGIGRARKIAGIEDVLVAIRDGYELVPLPEGGNYLGFIFARADTPDRVEAALRAAYAELNIVVAPFMALHDAR